MIQLWQSIVLGLVQGLSEFLPISSSGHLILTGKLMGISFEEGIFMAFSVLLHLGTLISVLIVFWKDVSEMLVEFFRMIGEAFRGEFNINKTPHRRLIFMLLLATIPLVLGAVLEGMFESAFSSTMVVGIALIITGALLYITNKLQEGTSHMQNTTYTKAFIVGLFQLIAVTPGLSRSGTTIFAARLNKFTKEFAVKFSFLMSIIAILGATVLEIKDLFKPEAAGLDPFICLIGIAVAAISGIFAIKFLVNLLNKGKYSFFAYYCWIAGIVTIVLTLTKGLV